MALRDGDRFIRCEQGHLHWGRYGAAGLLAYHDGHVLLQLRAWWTMGGRTWGIFGGARDSHEDATTAALRETAEESTLPTDSVRVHGVLREDHGRWAYDTVVGSVPTRVEVRPGSPETKDAAWVPVAEVDRRHLFPPFANAWPRLRACLRRPVLVVDGANVVGSRADGWWRDRAGAAARLRDRLDRIATEGLAGLDPFDHAYPEVILVVEGAARGIGAAGTAVRVVDAPASGDDTIVSVVDSTDADAATLVITADRELRRRCEAAGATVAGPRWLLDRLPAEGG